jgi:ATP cone domain
MNRMDATFARNTSPATIEWIRKRDGEVVRLESDKLTQSLAQAAEQLKEPASHETVAELGRMALFFLCSNITGDIATSDEVAEWTEKSLRETGSAALADLYVDYRQRKFWARRSLAVCTDEPAEELGRVPSAFWDKSRIVQSLRARLQLDNRRARTIASQVERYVVRGRFDRLTTHLIRELVNGELARWNVHQRLAPPGEIHIHTAQLKRALTSTAGLAASNMQLSRRIWHEFSLHEIVSRDVADAERRGLLHVHGLGAPCSLGAVCVDCGTLARQSLGFRQSIVQFGEHLADAIDSCSRLLAVDRVESWLSFAAEPGDTPGRLAEQFWIELRSRLRYCPLPCVLNLYGGMPPGADTALGAGPLFSQQPLSAEREFAGAVSQEILDLVRRDAAEWPNLRLDWHWVRRPDAVQTALIARIMRVLDEGHHVAIAFDREPATAGEGLRRLRDVIRSVLDFIGISLPVVWRDAGSPRSLPVLEDGLRQSIQLAVRAAIQKREFIRRLPTRIESPVIDHAILAIYPIGLDWTARQLVGRSAAEDEGSLKLCETLVRLLRDTAAREARHFGLGTVVDHPLDIPEHAIEPEPGNGEPDERVAGLVPVGPNLGLRRQIYAAGRLHAIAQAGTLVCGRKAAEENHNRLVETMEWALRNSELVRLQLVSDRPTHDQAVVGWPD